jgi:hypothetical protein
LKETSVKGGDGGHYEAGTFDAKGKNMGFGGRPLGGCG